MVSLRQAFKPGQHVTSALMATQAAAPELLAALIVVAAMTASAAFVGV